MLSTKTQQIYLSRGHSVMTKDNIKSSHLKICNRHDNTTNLFLFILAQKISK